MKTILCKDYSRVALAILMLAASMAVSRADTIYYQNTFDNSSSFQTTANYNPPPIAVRFDSGTATAHSTFSAAWASGPTYDAGGSSGSGSVKINWNWNYTADGAGSCAIVIDLFPAQITNASAISFDIMLDPSSTPGGFGDYGYFQVVTRDNSYNWNNTSFAEGLITAVGGTPGVWTHINIPLTGVNTNVRAITIQDYVDSGRAIVGPETIYIDNLTISVPGVTVPPTNYISPAGTKGLYMLTSVNSAPDDPAYQRQGIRTVNAAYGWVGSGAHPVTYSLTIADFPNSAHSNFEAYIFFVPTNSASGGPTEANPDWYEIYVGMLSIQNHADGTASAGFQYKVDDAEGNDYTYLGNVSGPSALGTWSITFSNNDYITLAAPGPGGATFSTNLAIGDGSYAFGTPLGLYIGTRPNSTNNTGQQNIFSQFQVVSNAVTLLNETFSTPTLSSTWAVAAEDVNDILQVPPGTAYLLSWTLPDTGFNLQVSTNLADSSAWHDPGLAKTTFNGKRTVLIPSTMVATNSPALFRLKKP
jgi:hypothetical protein